MEQIGKFIVLVGIGLTVVGLLLIFFDKLPFNLGRLPGDIYIKRDNFVFYFPMTTSILISIILSILLIIISKISR